MTRQTIDRELGWAAELGFNLMRVYLHDLVWEADPAGFKERINQYLEIADKHRIRTMFVLFDDCWHDDPKLGKQPEPRPGVHNSGWVKGPGSAMLKNPSGWERLREYVTDIVSSYGSDERVVVWDIYNEPGNNFLISLNLPIVVRYTKLLGQLFKHMVLPSPTERLLKEAFQWARSANPGQPLSAGAYYLRPKLGAKLNPVSLENSDVVSFHSYFKQEDSLALIAVLEKKGRPMLCTEYLSRTTGNNFETHMPIFKEKKIGCINWGLVSGKTQTIYSWEDHYPGGEEPPLWFHDILRPDGSPYKEEEKDFIQKMTRE